MITKIRTAEEYKKVMQIIESYLSRATEGGGFQTLHPEEAEELRILSELAEAWEDSIPLMPVKPPQSLEEMIEYKMYQKKLKQKDLAAMLEIAPSFLSAVLNGKRKVNINLAKKLYLKLGIDADFILRNV